MTSTDLRNRARAQAFVLINWPPDALTLCVLVALVGVWPR